MKCGNNRPIDFENLFKIVEIKETSAKRSE